MITPSFPTFSIASAIKAPISGSLFAEIEAMFLMSAASFTGLEFFLISSTATATALSIPRLISIGVMPAATDLNPSRTSAYARTVEVVVPSPASSFVFEATSRTNCAPIFSYGSASSISFATETPSFVIVGAPYFLSSITIRPQGPSVTFTAFAICSTPESNFLRASSLNINCFAIFYNLYILFFYQFIY